MAAIKTLDERIKHSKKKQRGPYSDPYNKLMKLIRTWLQEQEVLEAFENWHFVENDHDFLFDNTEFLGANSRPDFVRDDGLTIDLKVYEKSVDEIRFNNEFIKSCHGADLILLFSKADWLAGLSGFCVLKKTQCYAIPEYLSSNDADNARLEALGRDFMDIERTYPNKKYF